MPPSSLATIGSSSSRPMPTLRSSSAWRARWRRSSGMTSAGMTTLRARPPFVSLRRIPAFVCSRLSQTASVAFCRSLPLQRDDLASTQATERGQQNGNERSRRSEMREQRRRVGGIEHVHRFLFDLGRLDPIRWIAHQESPFKRLLERLTKNAVHVQHGLRGQAASAVPTKGPLSTRRRSAANRVSIAVRFREEG